MSLAASASILCSSSVKLVTKDAKIAAALGSVRPQLKLPSLSCAFSQKRLCHFSWSKRFSVGGVFMTDTDQEREGEVLRRTLKTPPKRTSC